MKKLFAFVVLFFGLNQFASAQDKFVVKIDKKICLDELTLVFKDKTSLQCQLGCYGEYEFDMKGKEFDHVIINGTTCYLKTTEIVFVNDKEQAKNKIIKTGSTIVDDLNGLIR